MTNENWSEDAKRFMHEEITRLVQSGVPHDRAFREAIAEARRRGLRVPDALHEGGAH